MVDYTATADIDAGDMILVGNLTGWTLGVAHVDIANAATAAIAAGGGVRSLQSANSNQQLAVSNEQSAVRDQL